MIGGFFARLFGAASPAGNSGDVDFAGLNRVLGTWRPARGDFLCPGTSLPATLELPRGVRRHGLSPGPNPLSEVLFPCWLRISPRLATFVGHEVRAGRMYTRHELPREGKTPRIIHSPRPILKFIQRRILERILNQIQLHDDTHGFVRGRSVFTALERHAGKRMVLTMDLRDFFPSITQGRVIGVFRAVGLDEKRARLLARLCCLDGRLPQGAPTSPALANIICRRLDKRLAGLARKAGADYTRYADDLIFSGSSKLVGTIPLLRKIVEDEGFAIAEEKTLCRRSGSRQRVLGLNVNTCVSVPRTVRRCLRAMVHRQAASPSADDGMVSFLMGHIAFMKPGHPGQADRLRRQLTGRGF